MTINSDIKQKEKQANMLYEKQWQRQQNIQFIKGLLFVVIFISVIMMFSLL